MSLEALKPDFRKFGKEFRSEILKAIAAAIVVTISGIAATRITSVREFLTAQRPWSYLTIVCLCLFVAAMAAALTFAANKRKIAQLRAELVRMTDSATRDSLTNLYNANQIQPILRERIEKALKGGEHFWLIMIDIDNFKRINDQYTHSIGNFILRQIADQLPGRSGGDATFRFGGDEFLIASKLGGRENEGYGFADRIRREVADTQFLVEENSHRRESLTVSCGVTAYRSNDTPEELIARITQALHLAKQPRKDPDGIDREKNFVYILNQGSPQPVKH